MPDVSLLDDLRIYFHGQSKRQVDAAGIPSKKILHLTAQGRKLELYKIISPTAEVKEKNIDLSPDLRKGFSLRRIISRLTNSIKINFGFGDRDFLLKGWSRIEMNESYRPFCWAEEIESIILIPLTKLSDYQLTLRVSPLIYEDSPEQTMEIYINDKYLTKLSLKKEWAKYSLDVPGSFWIKGNNLVKFKYGWIISPGEVSDSPDTRKLAVAFDYISLERTGRNLVE